VQDKQGFIEAWMRGASPGIAPLSINSAPDRVTKHEAFSSPVYPSELTSLN